MGVAIHRGNAGDEPRALAREAVLRPTTPTAPPTTLRPTTVAPPTTPPTTVPPPPPPAPPTTVAPDRSLSSARPISTLDPYRGLGTWVDVYDWSRTYGRGTLVGPGDVDQTLYIQTTRWDAPSDVLDGDLLVPIITRAHLRGLRVVGWYLPALTDPGADLRKLVAAAHLGVDGLAVDMEARNVSDVGERNRRLIGLADALRHTLPDRTLGAIVLPPVVLDVINPHYWPAFPWPQLAPYFDVWLPMAYWTNRSPSSGYRSSYRYTDENITRVRQHLGRPADYLLAARDLLTSGGLLVVEVPDCNSPSFVLLGRRCLTFDFPHHLVFFNLSSLRMLLEQSGFQVVGICRFSLEYSPYTTLQNLLNLLPGEPNRLYRALMRNNEGRRLRRSPVTWLHAILGALLAAPAFLLSLLSVFLPFGNNLRVYCRKT